jgi:hypothetical protein
MFISCIYMERKRDRERDRERERERERDVLLRWGGSGVSGRSYMIHLTR